MECVGYDSDFQLGLIEKDSTWVPLRRGKKNGVTKQTWGGRKAKVLKMKNKHKEQETELENKESSAEELSDSSEDELALLTTRGTRSRPVIF